MTHPKVERSKEMLRAHAEALREHVEDSEKLLHPTNKKAGAVTPPDVEHCEYVADAIERYLSGEVDTMDHALGLVAPRGVLGSKHGKPGKHASLAIDLRRGCGPATLGSRFPVTLPRFTKTALTNVTCEGSTHARSLPSSDGMLRKWTRRWIGTSLSGKQKGQQARQTTLIPPK